jgi:hypothetical protein
MSRLTLNLGLRWEPFLPWNDPVAEQVGGYIPGAKSTRFPNAPAGMLFAGDPGFPSGGVYPNLSNFAPRLGFAYALNNGSHPTSIRGGWGMFYIQPFARIYNNFVQNAPFSPSVALTGVSLADPFGSAGVQNPFPPFAPVHPNASTTFLLPIAYQFFDPHFHIGHTRGYNFTIEHQFARNLVARASYIGTQGRDLAAFQEIDPAIYGPGATSSNTNARRPLAPNYASMIEMTNGGYSNYNAFQLTVEHRFSKGLSFVANYTYSKAQLQLRTLRSRHSPELFLLDRIQPARARQRPATSPWCIRRLADHRHLDVAFRVARQHPLRTGSFPLRCRRGPGRPRRQSQSPKRSFHGPTAQRVVQYLGFRPGRAGHLRRQSAQSDPLPRNV